MRTLNLIYQCSFLEIILKLFLIILHFILYFDKSLYVFILSFCVYYNSHYKNQYK